MTPCKYDWRGLYQLDMARGRLKMNVAGLTYHCPNIAGMCSAIHLPYPLKNSDDPMDLIRSSENVNVGKRKAT